MGNEIKTISILGYGWLGAPLAQHLLSKGYHIKASTTSESKMQSIAEAGIEPYLLSLDPRLSVNDFGFFQSDLLIINFPPRRRPDIVPFHTEQIRSIIQPIVEYSISNILYISSTSVYPSVQRIVTEDDILPAEKGSGQALQIAEELLMSLPGQQTTVLRLAGLVGDDRVPGRFLAGKTDVENADAPVNLIHRDDCIGVISSVIERKAFGQLFNVCMDEHPTRRQFYEAAAIKAGLNLPQFGSQSGCKFKIVDSSKLKRMLGYQMRYTNPMDIL